jgi:3-hydroxyisobutyrate dehydrogenase
VETVGFVGLGTMGAAMAANLSRAGARLTVWNRTPGKATALVALGATEAGSPAELAAAVDVVVVCVSDTPDVEAVLFGPGGVAEGIRSGSLVVDCSTISPIATAAFGKRLAERGVAMVDAPVSGGSEGAAHGTLTIFAGGSEADVARARPILAAMGKTITRMGPLGAGQTAKAVNQVMICGYYMGVAEGLVLGMEAGLDMDRLVQALSGGAAQSWVLEHRCDRIIEDSYAPGFRLTLHRKDLAIALELAGSLGLRLPVATVTSIVEDGLLAAGRGDEDMSVVAAAIRPQPRDDEAADADPDL